MDWTAIVALMAMVVLMFGAILFLFCYEQYRIHQIKNGELMIVEDLLTLSYEDVEKRGGGGGRHAIHVRVFILEFQHMGRFRVPRRPHYEWSKIYSMSDEGVYNTSTLGDRFYVVYLKNARKQEPLMVYNTNLFELCEDGTAPRTGGSWKDSVSLE
ncbi:MAG: hypothetical protein J6R82_01925 [Clostridia bacterium]|nr:hypothetical protein [Clostridia bacterium]